MDIPNVEVLQREVLLTTRIFRLRADLVRAPDQRTHTWYVLEHPGSVVIVPIDAHGRVWFVRQYRHAVGRVLLEFPAGTLEPDESPLTCAQRELAEEIGMRATDWLELGTFYVAPGYSSERMVAYLARGLEPVSGASPDADELLKPEAYPLTQVETWMRTGRIQDGKSLAAWLLAQAHLTAA
ncbi:MAG: NUDIX hydrolase [Chloroflexi bacterium]|nr:NUDIX hydrolase [Chloroflexota bacterium]